MLKRKIRGQNRLRWVGLNLCLLLVLALVDGHALIADTYSDRRVMVGLNLFRALLVADQEAEAKADEAGELPVLVLYVDDRIQADSYAETLQLELGSIREHRTRIESVSLNDYLSRFRDTPLPSRKRPPPLGIFISQRLTGDELERLIRRSIEQGVILFSPFEGDVEKGVLAGLSVQVSVRPYINLKALKETGIAVKPFYLRVARTYE